MVRKWVKLLILLLNNSKVISFIHLLLVIIRGNYLIVHPAGFQPTLCWLWVPHARLCYNKIYYETDFKIAIITKQNHSQTDVNLLKEVEVTTLVVVVPDVLHASCLYNTHDRDGNQWTKENDELKYVRPNDSFYATLKFKRNRNSSKSQQHKSVKITCQKVTPLKLLNIESLTPCTRHGKSQDYLVIISKFCLFCRR